MKLPNPDQAVVSLSKLRDYCLNPIHPKGRHKARVFASALGLFLGDAEFLRVILLRAARSAEAIPTLRDEFGQRYIIDFHMAGPKGEATIRSGWIILWGEDFPRFLSCYVL
jgi:hypothetical protein